MRNSKEVSKEEYNEFYKKAFSEFLDPLPHTHFTTEVHFSYIYCVIIPLTGCLSFVMSCVQRERLSSGAFYTSLGWVLLTTKMLPPENKEHHVKCVFISDEFDGELVSLSSFFYNSF